MIDILNYLTHLPFIFIGRIFENFVILLSKPVGFTFVMVSLIFLQYSTVKSIVKDFGKIGLKKNKKAAEV